MAFELKTKIWLLLVNERGGVGEQRFQSLYTSILLGFFPNIKSICITSTKILTLGKSIYWHWNMSAIYQIVDKSKLQKEHTEYDHIFWQK